MADSIEAAVTLVLIQRLRELEARAKVALMFFPAEQLSWVYHQGNPVPDLKVRVNDR